VIGDLPNCQSTLGKVLQLSNLTDWTPFDPNFVPTNTKYSLSVCTSGSDPTEFIKPFLVSYPESQLVGQLDELSFGLLYADNSSSYESIVNGNENWYGNSAQTAVFSMDFRGLGLPPQSFNQFAHLLNLASGGAATCETQSGGICLLSDFCDAFP